MRRDTVWEQASSEGGFSDYEAYADAPSVLNARSNSGVSLWSEPPYILSLSNGRNMYQHFPYQRSLSPLLSAEGTDEEGYHTPTSQLSRASSLRSNYSRPASALMHRKHPPIQSGLSRAWVRVHLFEGESCPKSVPVPPGFGRVGACR